VPRLSPTVAPDRPLEILLTACVSLGLLVKRGETYANAHASQTYLVRGAPSYFGDYYRFQIDRQVYPAFARLPAALRGERAEFYRLMDDPEEAMSFSPRPARGLPGPRGSPRAGAGPERRPPAARRRRGQRRLQHHALPALPRAAGTILDFSTVQAAAATFIDEAGMADRIRFAPGNALSTEWPGGQDVVLLSYLLSAVSAPDVDRLLARAFGALEPGGRIVLHDFMVDDEGTGPSTAALWLVNALLIDPDVARLSPAFLEGRLRAHRFGALAHVEIIPGITRTIIGVKPRSDLL
jgi:hypothetical protein